MNIRDNIALGFVSGLAGTVPTLIINYLLVAAHVNEYYAHQISGGIFLRPELTETLGGAVFGGIIWLITSGFVGVLLAYSLRLTGYDFWWFKGPLLVSMVMYVAIYGFVFNIGGARVVPWDLGSNASLLATNLVYGFCTGYLIVRWGQKQSASPSTK